MNLREYTERAKAEGDRAMDELTGRKGSNNSGVRSGSGSSPTIQDWRTEEGQAYAAELKKRGSELEESAKHQRPTDLSNREERKDGNGRDHRDENRDHREAPKNNDTSHREQQKQQQDSQRQSATNKWDDRMKTHL